MGNPVKSLAESPALLPLYVGCDPGATGALALVSGAWCAVWDVPLSAHPVGGSVIDDAATIELARVLACFGPAAFVIEHTWGVRGQGGSSQYKFGDSAAALRMAFQSTGFPVRRVSAQKWQTHFRVNGDKQHSVALVKKLYPAHVELFTANRGHINKAQCEARAEAVLIGRFGEMTKIEGTKR